MSEVFTKLITLILVLLGILFLSRGYYPFKEGFSTSDVTKCPNLLVRKGNVIELLNSNKGKVPGVNPLKFNSLEEYIEFVNWQRQNGIRCPVLYLQQMYTTQGDAAYSIRPSPTDPQGGLPPDVVYKKQQTQESLQLLTDSNRDDPPFNQNSYPGFDPQNQDIGRNTPLDKMFHEDPNKLSPNPMDTNWGGAKYSETVASEELKSKALVDTRIEYKKYK